MSLYDDIPLEAGADLTATQYKAVQIGGTIASTNTNAVGIQQNKPKSGEDLSARIHGRSRYSAGGAVTKGNRLAVTTSGWIVAVASNQFGVGIALSTVASGATGDGWFNNFGAPTTVVSAHLT